MERLNAVVLKKGKHRVQNTLKLRTRCKRLEHNGLFLVDGHMDQSRIV